MAKFDEKMKMKLIIKTYIILNGSATAKELAVFLNSNFKWCSYISSRSIATMLTHTTYKGHILYGLQKRRVTVFDTSVLEYYFEDNDVCVEKVKV